MITTEQARTLALASEATSNATGSETPFLEGYGNAVKTFYDPNTGFQAAVYQKEGTKEYIVAFAGTGDAQDAAADLALGTPQWEKNKIEVIDYLNTYLKDATNIDFTGRSLGGALAQYAAYDYLATTQASAQVSLTTYNGLGGIAGLKQMYGENFDSTLASGLDAAHFFTSSDGNKDMVTRLGEGHFGGETYEIPMSETDAGVIGIHLAWDYFNNLTNIPSSSTSPDYLNVAGAQKLASLFTFIGDDGKFDNTEGFFRAAGGALLSLSTATPNEFDQIIDAMRPDMSFVDWGLARDLMPLPLRLEVAILGMESIGIANAYQLYENASEWTTEQINATVALMEEAVKIGEYALKQAIETGSELIDAACDIYMKSLDYAADRVMDLVATFNNALDYTADKWQEMQNLSNQITGWLSDQLAYVGQVANETTKLGSWAIQLMIDGAIDSNVILSAINIFTTASTTAQRRDPLILDRDNDGAETIGVDAGAYFDHDANGFAEQTGWVSPDDGLLVRDINGNGTIDTGRELFGDNTLLKDGTLATDGLQALADLDDNGDGKVDAADSSFNQLRVWEDSNSDGISQAGELKTLDELNIKSLNTIYTVTNITDSTGNTQTHQATYETTDGMIHQMGNFLVEIEMEVAA